MKTIIKLAVTGLVVLFISSCSETNERPDNSMVTIYENQSNEGVSSPSLFKDNLKSVEQIGKDHRIFKEITRELGSSGLQSNNYDLNSLKRFRYNYTQCNLFSLERKDGCGKTIFYEYDGQYLIAQAKLEQISDTISLFELHTNDGNICYSMEVSISNLIGEIRIEENRLLNEFRTRISREIRSESTLKGAQAAYCRQEESWGDCMACSMEYCSTKWFCSIAVVVYPIEFIAGFAASCIGAGPDATP